MRSKAKAGGADHESGKLERQEGALHMEREKQKNQHTINRGESRKCVLCDMKVLSELYGKHAGGTNLNETRKTP